MTTTNLADTLVEWRTSQGLKNRATLVRLTRHLAVFEIYSPDCVLRTSEVLDGFQIVIQDRPAYAGRATVQSLVTTGQIEVCAVTLNEDSWKDLALDPEWRKRGFLRGKFSGFMEEWQKLYKIRPEYKIIIADMQSFLMDLRLWLDQAELGARTTTKAEQAEFEQTIVAELAEPIIGCVNTLFEKFELIAGGLEENSLPAHRSYMRRQLHALVMCAPFAYRTFHKPLGYAGDYEMVNMIARNIPEGGSLYAKLVNAWFLQQPPAVAHRNRIQFLKGRLVDEAARAARGGRPLRVMNLGCGPSREVQEFLMESRLSDAAQFTLLDFNDETIEQARAAVERVKRESGRQTGIKFQKKSAMQFLREGMHAPANGAAQGYEFVYCAGLFDYLADRTCRQLMNIFYDQVAPGGLLLATNVDPSNPLRNGMEHLLDWNLVYRNGRELSGLRPDRAPEDSVSVLADATGVNVIIEVRKPAHA